MKVLQVNCVYQVGSTGKIVHDIHSELKKNGMQSVVCYGRGKKPTEPDVYRFGSELEGKLDALRSRLTGLMYGGCFFSTNKVLSIIKKEAPDIVHIHCINGHVVNIYRLISWLKQNRIKTVLTLHAEFPYTANCGYAMECEKWKTGCGSCPRLRQETKSWFFDGTARSWEKMRQAFAGFEDLRIIAVSDWIAGRAKQSPILGEYEISRIHNGIDLQNFVTDKADNERQYLHDKYGYPSVGKIALHVTPDFDNPIKGGEYILQLTDQLPEDYQMVVVGCERQLHGRILSIPFVENQKDLAAIYRGADVFVITSRAENYPTVCIEANCCGTPVVGFDVGGVKETIGVGMGEAVLPFDMDALTERTLYWAHTCIDQDLLYQRRIYCDKARMTADYLKWYQSL